MKDATFDLLARRRFLPLFVTQFLGAMNDNVLKNALIILVTYKLAAAAGLNGQILATAAAGIFILPFFLLSATAGQLADKLDKQRMTVWVKASEVAIMALAAAGFFAESVTLLMTALFLMGVHSTFFGPIKYGILPAHLGRHELLAGNALIEAGTFLAILIGTILGGVLILLDGGVAMTALLMLAVAAGGLAASLYIPGAPPPAPGLQVDVNPLSATRTLLADARADRTIWLSILGISWFWLVGATFLSQLPAFTKDVLGADEHVVTLFLTVFSVGIGLGSLLCNRLLGGDIAATYVPLGALGMSAFGIDLYFAASAVPAYGDGLIALGVFVGQVHAWRILADLMLVAVFGGLYIVPLYAILQSTGEDSHRSRIIAANNVVNAAFMVAAALATAIMLVAGLSVPAVFLTISVLNLGAFVFLWPLARAARATRSGG
jgi:acyl-[acyl-carrier-protein]-phospholipid O-acyltransferase/long-chain-fatty-acid--[acyl-carrier-protein] ligase